MTEVSMERCEEVFLGSEEAKRTCRVRGPGQNYLPCCETMYLLMGMRLYEAQVRWQREGKTLKTWMQCPGK